MMKENPSLLRGLKQRVRESPSEVTTGAADCLLFVRDDMYIDGHSSISNETVLHCEDEKGHIYKINGLESNFFENNNIKSGQTRMIANETIKVRDSLTEDDHIIIANHSEIDIVENESRRFLVSTKGKKTLLIIRAVSNNGAPRSASQISSDIFGSRTDKVNLVSQYKACSGGKLNFVPATGKKIQAGVLTVKVKQRFGGMRAATAANHVKDAAEKAVGSLSKWTHYMIVLQDDADFEGRLAFAYINGARSVFRSKSTQNVLTQMHELGHNLGLGHSGRRSERNEEYGDKTCMMGSSPSTDETPRMCFNGAKSWYLDWYSDRQITVTPTNKSWTGNLVGVDDYVKRQTQQGKHYVVVRIDDTRSGTDLYVMYNRKEGVNAGVAAFPNMVTIVSGSITKTSEQSWLLAGLRAGGVYRNKKFSGQSSDLVIKVCSMKSGRPDYAKVLIYLDKGRRPKC